MVIITLNIVFNISRNIFWILKSSCRGDHNIHSVSLVSRKTALSIGKSYMASGWLFIEATWRQPSGTSAVSVTRPLCFGGPMSVRLVMSICACQWSKDHLLQHVLSKYFRHFENFLSLGFKIPLTSKGELSCSALLCLRCLARCQWPPVSLLAASICRNNSKQGYLENYSTVHF